MNADQQIEKAETALLAAGARQYVKATIQDFIENSLNGLEGSLGSKEINVERVFTTLEGIMAMRQFLRKVDADIHRGTEAQPPPLR